VFQPVEDAVGREGDRPDLDDAVMVRVEAGGFEIEGDVLGHRLKIRSGRILGACRRHPET